MGTYDTVKRINGVLEAVGAEFEQERLSSGDTMTIISVRDGAGIHGAGRRRTVTVGTGDGLYRSYLKTFALFVSRIER